MSDGGPAFPAQNYIVPQDLEARHVHALGKTQGMTLRDYFAAHAPAPPDEWRGNYRFMNHEDYSKFRAQWSFEYADAMLARRSDAASSEGETK